MLSNYDRPLFGLPKSAHLISLVMIVCVSISVTAKPAAQSHRDVLIQLDIIQDSSSPDQKSRREARSIDESTLASSNQAIASSSEKSSQPDGAVERSGSKGSRVIILLITAGVLFFFSVTVLILRCVISFRRRQRRILQKQLESRRNSPNNNTMSERRHETESLLRGRDASPEIASINGFRRGLSNEGSCASAASNPTAAADPASPGGQVARRSWGDRGRQESLTVPCGVDNSSGSASPPVFWAAEGGQMMRKTNSFSTQADFYNSATDNSYVQLDSRNCNSGPSSLNVSTNTLRRPSTISMGSSRNLSRPGRRNNLIFMHKDSLIVPPPAVMSPASPKRSLSSARLERQRSHRDEDVPPDNLEIPPDEPGGDSLTPLPSRKLFVRQPSDEPLVPRKPLNRLTSQTSTESGHSLTNFSPPPPPMLSPPTIVEIGCSNPDLSVIQNNATPPQRTIYQPKPSLLSGHIPPSDVQETSLNIPVMSDRRNSSPHVMLNRVSPLVEPGHFIMNAAKAKRLEEIHHQSQDSNGNDIELSTNDITENESSGSSPPAPQLQCSSPSVSYLDRSFSPSLSRVKRSKRASSDHALIRSRTQRTCSQSYCVCTNCLRYIQKKVPELTHDMQYILMTEKIRNKNGSVGKCPLVKKTSLEPLNLTPFLNLQKYPHMQQREQWSIVNRAILRLLADKLTSTL